MIGEASTCEPRQLVRIETKLIRLNLVRLFTIQLQIASPVHRAHPAFYEIAGDPVMSNLCRRAHGVA